MNIYVGIDGVLLDEKDELVENVSRFLQYVTSQHRVFWLLEKGTEEAKIKTLSTKLPPEDVSLLERIRHAEWLKQRTDGIDFSQEFRWFVKSISANEHRTLRSHNVVTSLYCANGRVGIETIGDNPAYFKEHGVPQWSSLKLNLSYTPEQFSLIREGFDRGRDMDYKWHIYVEDDWLYLDRSWTDFCSYRIRFEMKDGVCTAVEAYDSLSSTTTLDEARNQYHGDMIKELLRLHIFDREIQ